MWGFLRNRGGARYFQFKSSLAIKTVVLIDEDEIEDNRDIAQQPLCGIPQYRRPIVAERGVDDELEDRKQSTNQIKYHCLDGESDGGLAAPVNPHLRYVLDHCKD